MKMQVWLAFVGEIMGTCLGMVGVVLLTRASKVDQQVSFNVLLLLLLLLLLLPLFLLLLIACQIACVCIPRSCLKMHAPMAAKPRDKKTN